MAEKKKILYIVEAMGGGVFTYIVDLANELVNSYDMYIAYAVRKQTPENYKDYFDKRIHLIEGLPISLLESMYMKKACVVSNVIGNRDVIHNGENGFVCTKVEDFVKAIEECQGEDGKLTERAYQDILKRYNTKVMYLEFSSSISNVFVPKVNKIVAETDNNTTLTKLFTSQ